MKLTFEELSAPDKMTNHYLMKFKILFQYLETTSDSSIMSALMRMSWKLFLTFLKWAQMSEMSLIYLRMKKLFMSKLY